jgi:thiol:disulfide interchange protein
MGKKRKKTNQNTSKILIMAGFLIILAAIFLLKDGDTSAQTTGILPEEQLAQALTSGKPVLAFYHSNNCQSCIDMIAVVNQVYPEFKDDVVLVDVDVYDQQNQALLRNVGLQYIPTQMFYDRSGTQSSVVGVMQPDSLRESLRTISSGQ